MAVTLTALRNTLRVGNSAMEESELLRLRGYAEVQVDHYAPNAPPAAHDEAVIRLCAYLYDQPNASGTARHANAFLNSGAQSALTMWKERRGVNVPPPPAPPPAIWRLGWEDARIFTEASFVRTGNHPADGVVEGSIAVGLTPPPFPAGDFGGRDLFLGIWIAGAGSVLESALLGTTDSLYAWPEADKGSLSVEEVEGVYYPSTQRLVAGISYFTIYITIEG